MANILSINLQVNGLPGAAGQINNYQNIVINANQNINNSFNQTNSTLRSSIGQFAALGGAGALLFSGLKTVTKAAFDAEKANRQLSASATQAGLSYQFLAEKAKGFAEEGGLSQTVANRTEGLIAKLAQASGKPGDLDKIETALLDTASARGIQVAQLETLVNAVISGSSDEPLNAVGLSDPGKLAKDYADSLGKSVEALTKQELVLSRLNPLLQQAETVTGANVDRLASLSGQSEITSARLDDLQTNLGKGFTNSLEFRDALGLLNSALKDLTTSPYEITLKLKDGKTPKQIAEEEAGSTTSQVLDLARNVTSIAPANFAFIYDVFSGEGFETANKRYLATVTGAKERRVEALTGLIEAEQKVLDKQNAAAEKQKAFLSGATFADQEKARKEDDKKRLDERRKSFNLKFSSLGGLDDINQNRQLLNELNQNQDLFTPEELAKRVFDTQQKIKKSIDEGKQKVESLGKAYTSVFADLFAKTGANNPIFTVMNEGNKAIDVLKENLKGLPAELQNIAIAMQQKLNANALFGARLDNNLEVLGLRESANAFRNPARDFEAEAKRRDEVARASALRGGFMPFGGNFGSDLAQKAGGFDKLTDTQKREVYEIASLENGLQNKSERFADLNNRSLISSLARERSGGNENLSLQERLDRQFKVIDSLNPKSDAERAIAERKLIAITEGLNPAELNSSQRERAASARENEADRKARSEQEDRTLRAENLAVQKQIADNGKRLLDLVEKEGFSKIQVLIDAEGNVSTTTENPKRATNEDTGSLYNDFQNALSR